MPEVTPLDAPVMIKPDAREARPPTEDGASPGEVDAGAGDAAPDERARDGRYQCALIDNSVRWKNPKVVVALDRSSSMTARPSGGDSRLTQAQRALFEVIHRYRLAISFGYVEFPVASCSQGQGCCASSLISPSRTSLSNIRDRWECDSQPPSCHDTTRDSPLAEALSASYPYFVNDLTEVSRKVIVLTDDEPSCAARAGSEPECARTERQVANLANIQSGVVETIFFGLTAALGTNQCLSQLAAAGASSGTPTIAVGEDQIRGKLDDLLEPLAREACTFEIDPSVDLTDGTLRVMLDDRTEVFQDKNRLNGWDIEPGVSPRVTIYGPACREIATSRVDDRDVILCR